MDPCSPVAKRRDCLLQFGMHRRAGSRIRESSRRGARERIGEKGAEGEAGNRRWRVGPTLERPRDGLGFSFFLFSFLFFYSFLVLFQSQFRPLRAFSHFRPRYRSPFSFQPSGMEGSRITGWVRVSDPLHRMSFLFIIKSVPSFLFPPDSSAFQLVRVRVRCRRNREIVQFLSAS